MKFFNIILIVFLLSISASKAALRDPALAETLTDEAFVRRAQTLPCAQHVVKLEAVVNLCGYRKTIFSASAVCIENTAGGMQFLTNAHCVEPWLDRARTLKYSLQVNVEGITVPITHCHIHEKYFLEEGGKKNLFDIAFLSTDESNPELLGIEPTYFREPVNLIGKNLDIIGYGASGDVGSFLGRNDGKKRAVTSPLTEIGVLVEIEGEKLPGVYPLADCSLIKQPEKNSFYLINNGSNSQVPYEGGLRKGMSGGGTFLDFQYMAIPSRDSKEASPILKKIVPRWIRHSTKYLASLGIPVPFVKTLKGGTEKHLLLGFHQEWIEKARRQDRERRSLGL